MFTCRYGQSIDNRDPALLEQEETRIRGSTERLVKSYKISIERVVVVARRDENSGVYAGGLLFWAGDGCAQKRRQSSSRPLAASPSPRAPPPADESTPPPLPALPAPLLPPPLAQPSQPPPPPPTHSLSRRDIHVARITPVTYQLEAERRTTVGS